MTLTATEPVAPVEIWTPFWAMYGVAPAPVTVVLATLPVNPLPSMTTPFFW